MFRARTLLVLGAGASAEVGLPVGAKLLSEIVKLTDIAYDIGRMVRGDHHVSEALKHILNEGQAVEKYNEHLHAAWQLAASAKQALSIDNVIDALEDERVERVGKLGIVRAIHEAERSSNFFKDRDNLPDSLDVGKFKGTWYDSLTKLLCEGVKKSQVEGIFDNLEIINFNYDRCLEQYLPFSLGNYYGLNPNDIRELMPKLNMFRPYGVAGKLPWQPGNLPAVQFGGGHTTQTADAASQIRTFTERVEEGEELARIREATANAERIVFLGFAFHRQNVDLMTAKTLSNVEIVATAHEVSKSDQGVIEDELLAAFEISGSSAGSRVHMAEATCAKLFQDYWRTLTADERPPDHEYALDNI
jgi:hypothetical protein